MKNLDRLIAAYEAHPIVNKLVAIMKDTTKKHNEVLELAGSSLAFVLAASSNKNEQIQLVIQKDKEDAAYLLNTLTNLLDERTVLFFPDSFRRPMMYDRWDSTQNSMRAETINRIANTNFNGIVVTYPEALFEKVVLPEILAANKIEIIKEESLDVDFVIEVLIEYGFQRTDFVYEPGQFAIRGGIIDIFSFGNEYPYRIELFDDEVEQIRTFDPTSQLSQRQIAKVTIIPNINTRFTQSQKDTVFEVLPAETVIWLSNYEYILDRLKKCFDEAIKYADSVSTLDKSDLAELFRDRAFVPPTPLVKSLQTFRLFSLSPANQKLKPFDDQLRFQTKGQPTFNRNFKLLIENMEANAGQQIETYLFAENPKQIERFYAIFEDLKVNTPFHPIPKSIHKGFIDETIKVACYTDHEIFGRFHRYRLRKGYNKNKAINMQLIRSLNRGDYVTHIDHGIGRYSGLEKIDINGNVQESVRLIYKNNDVLYVSINSLHKITRYTGKEGNAPKLSKLGSESWKNLKQRTKKQVKSIAGELIKLYAKRKATPGHAFPKDGYLQNELEASFIYEDTPDQYKSTQEVKEDMMKAYPMDRLICGDVGFGKTEIAIRAAFKAAVGGKQVAILVPTTILALQHYKTFHGRLEEFGVTVDYINRFRTTKEKNQIIAQLKAGKIDIIIGTHALLNKKVGFKDLGLLVIDEEQKFGVSAKEKLRNFKVNVDTLTLTATPIPRTLQFSLMAARDLSILRTPPPNRQPIHTEMRVSNDELIRDAIYYEINRGGQVFFVHNRVKTLPDRMALIQRLCPDVDIRMAHGQMESKTLEKTLISFIDREYDVLICTNIIETGLDIPNANTIIINDAHFFGMSDLHQLRGRVGRSNKKAFCYLLTPPLSVLTTDARKRLQTLEEFSDLGSGFNIAMRDLDIRGAGDLLGAQQSGFITDIGYETYQRILEEAIQELKENEFKEVFQEDLDKQKIFVRDVQIDTDTAMLIPDAYVSNIQERLKLYTELDHIDTETKLQAFQAAIKDRFGKDLPKPTFNLFEGLRLRWISKQLGFERIILKNKKLRCYFIGNPQSSFYESDTFQEIVKFVGINGQELGLSFKKSNRYFILVKENVRNLEAAKRILQNILESIQTTHDITAN